MSEVASKVYDEPVLVAGASGFVGSHIAKLLVRQGRKVRLLVRKTSNMEALRDLDAQIHYGDVMDVGSLQAAMAGCATVFYSVVDPRFWLSDPKPLYRNNVEGLVNGMNAALACGIKRFIFTSTMGTLGLNPTGPVTEDIPFNWHAKASPYIKARLEAETQFLAYCRQKALPGVAMCIANTYGPEDFQPTPHGSMLWQVGSGKMRYVLNCSQPTVDIRDAANAAVLAEAYGRIGERYIIANEFVSQETLCRLATTVCGTKPPRLIPRSVAHAIASMSEKVLKLLGRRDFMVSADAVFLSNVFREMDSSKARRELHWEPRPLAETVKDALKWYELRDTNNSGPH